MLATINAAVTGLSYQPTLNFKAARDLADAYDRRRGGRASTQHDSDYDHSCERCAGGAETTSTINEDTPYTFSGGRLRVHGPERQPGKYVFQSVTIHGAPPPDGTLTLNGAPVQAGNSIILLPQAGFLPGPRLRRASLVLIPRVASSADGTKLLAAEESGHLYTSTDPGANWTARASPRELGSRRLLGGWDETAGGGVWRPALHLDGRGGHLDGAHQTHRPWWSVASSADGMNCWQRCPVAGCTPRPTRGPLDGAGELRGWYSVASSADGTTWWQRWKPASSTPRRMRGGRGPPRGATGSGGRSPRRRTGPSWWRRRRGSALHLDGFGSDLGPPRENNRRWLSVASSADGTRLVAAEVLSVSSTPRRMPESRGPRTREQQGMGYSVASSADGTKLIASSGEARLYTSNSSIGLVFTPDTNTNGSPYTSFTFKVQDDEDTLNGGANVDPLANTITINVTA